MIAGWRGQEQASKAARSDNEAFPSRASTFAYLLPPTIPYLTYLSKYKVRTVPR